MNGHGFTRERVKEYISRLQDGDADKIASFAEEAYRAGLSGMDKASTPGIINNEIATLCLRLGLFDGEIEGIQSEALEAGRRDGGHMATRTWDEVKVSLDQLLSLWSPEVVLRSLSESLLSRAEAVRDPNVARNLRSIATSVTRIAYEASRLNP